MTKYFVLFLIGFSVSFSLRAQEKSGILFQVKDSLSGEPLQGASIQLYRHGHAHITDERGITLVDTLANGYLLFHISYVGYHHQDVRIHAGKVNRVTIYLCPESYHLHESVITSSKDGRFTGRDKMLMSNDALRKNQGQNLAELMQREAGVTQMNSSGGIAKPVLRGLSGQRLVTLQGTARMEGQQWGDDHGLEADVFSVHSLEIVKGAASVEFGPEAIGGAIRILPPEWRSDTGIAGKLFFQGFSNNRQGAAGIYLEQGLQRKAHWAWRAQISGRRAGDSHAPDYVMSNTGFSEWAANAGFMRSCGKWEWENTISRYMAKMGILAASHFGNLSDLERALEADKPMVIKPFTYTINKPYQEIEHVLLNSKIQYRQRPGRLFTLQYTQQVNRRKEYDNDAVYTASMKGKPAVDLEIQTFILEQRIEQQLSYHWSLKAGVSLSHQYNTIAGIQYIIPPYKQTTWGLFAALKRELEEGNLTLGLRADYRHLEVEPVIVNGREMQDSRNFSGINAGLSWVRLLAHSTRLSLSLQSGWRPPAANELYSYGLHYGLAAFEIGNLGLNPERSVMAEIGLRKQWKKWQGSLSVYEHWFSNFIMRQPLPDPILTIRGAFPAFAFSSCEALQLGADAQVAYTPEKAWQWESRFSYMHAQNLSQDQPLYGMPANRMLHALGYKFADKHKKELELQSVWVARQNRYVPGMDYKEPPPGYVLMNMKAGMEIKLLRKLSPAACYLSVINILNTRYRDYQSRFRYFTDDPGIRINFQIIQNF